MLRSKSTMKQNAVVYMSDGTRRKGITEAFDPNKSTMLVKEIDVGGNVVEIHDVDMHSVYAIFFVRDLAIMRTSRHTSRDGGNPPQVPVNGQRVRVSFVWGEVIDGVAPNYDSKAPWFYLFPDGPLNRAYNIQRIYVNQKATARVETL